MKIKAFAKKKLNDNIEYLKNEMSVLCNIKSKYLSEYYETYDADDKYVYLVMEYIEGESLMDILCK